MLDEADLALLIRVCRDHVVASCAKCQKSYQLVELGSDPVAGLRFNRCPTCYASMEWELRTHLRDCPSIIVAQADARYETLAKESRQLIDTSRVQIAESKERVQRSLSEGICVVCRGAIQPGERRYRRSDGDYHARCFKE